MFDGLDDIDWEQFGDCHLGVSMKTKDIPTFVRKLRAEDAEEREYAIQCLLGEGQHLGLIGDATPAIIPYVLEVLADETYLERGFIVLGIWLMCENLYRYQSISYLRLALRTFDALKQGFPIYKRLLNDMEQETRLFTVSVMGFMQDHATEALGLLLQRLKIEQDSKVRKEIIERMITLVNNALSPYIGEGIDTLKSMYVYIKDQATYDEQLTYVRALDGLHFKHDPEIKDFMTHILTTSSQEKN